jgi:hypothetical protein
MIQNKEFLLAIIEENIVIYDEHKAIFVLSHNPWLIYCQKWDCVWYSDQNK